MKEIRNTSFILEFLKSKGAPDDRVPRGGSWYFQSRRLRCTDRGRLPEHTWADDLGFRLVMMR